MKDDRPMYLPLRRPEDFQLTWPLLPGGEPPIKSACNKNCTQGRACDCVPDIAAQDTERADMHEGAGAIVVPAVIAAALFVGALVALVVRWI